MSRLLSEELAQSLEYLAGRIREGDSMEGGVEWSWSDEPGVYDVVGMARVGNSLGQGSVILFQREEGQLLLHERAEAGQ